MSKKYYQNHKEDILKQKQHYYSENAEQIKKYKKDYYHANLAKMKQQKKKQREKSPWIFHLYSIRNRCNNPKATGYKNWGGRGIKCLITVEEIKQLWFEYCAWRLKQPTIDRIDNDGDYCLENCRFIEKVENIRKRNKEKPQGKKILQLDSQGNLIKEWNSLSKASKYFNVSPQAIYNAINHKRNTYFCKGFMWRYKNA